MESKLYELLKKIEGLQTVESVQKILKVKRNTAVWIIHVLRKKGLVKTKGGGKQPRFYEISTVPIREIGYMGLYETINKYSKIKLIEPIKHRVSKKMSVEEAIARAAASGEFRTVLASLGLFNHVKNWSRLYIYAVKYDVRRKIGALYDVARTAMKTRRMDERTKNKLKNGMEKRFIIKGMKSKDFLEIQKEWKIFVPFNKSDLERYRE